MTGGMTGMVRSAQPLADFSGELMEAAGGEDEPRSDDAQGVNDPDGKSGHGDAGITPTLAMVGKPGQGRGSPKIFCIGPAQPTG
jgi:hypothetical protein